MIRIGFRTRLLVILALFAVIPATVLTAAYAWSVAWALREVSGTGAWETVAQSGRDALDIADKYPLTAEERARMDAHRNQLSVSLTNASRLAVIVDRAPLALLLFALLAIVLLAIATSRVAGHLSRQLSRPLQELVGWTEMLARGEALPDTAAGRGAPEFEVLRQRMRRTAKELARGRDRAVEAERLRAFRESARQVAHELRNPLTPIRFAVSRLRRDVPPDLAESVEVLDIETARMENIARSFSIFGKLPEGPESEIDLAEMVAYTARATVPEGIQVDVDIEAGLPLLVGQYDALARALANVVLNAVEACKTGGSIAVQTRRSPSDSDSVVIAVHDTGIGIPADKLAGIWEPYVTHRSGGTGLGLAITRQTIEAHGGTVAASSEPGKGTTVQFTLPLRRTGTRSTERR